MGFGVSEIGEKRLKGLEMPEFILLIYPRSLAGRLNNQGTSFGGPDSKVDEVYEPAPRMLDVNPIRQLAALVVRLEADFKEIENVPSWTRIVTVSAATVHAPLSFSPSSPNPTNKLTAGPGGGEGGGAGGSGGSAPKRPKSKLLNGHLLTYPIRLESTDEELAAILENQVIRIENRHLEPRVTLPRPHPMTFCWPSATPLRSSLTCSYMRWNRLASRPMPPACS
ncbi:hypothetical protein PTTG_00439, partial [Puccinia triticina 1-1 BBBD Race 1]